MTRRISQSRWIICSPCYRIRRLRVHSATGLQLQRPFSRSWLRAMTPKSCDEASKPYGSESRSTLAKPMKRLSPEVSSRRSGRLAKSATSLLRNVSTRLVGMCMMVRACPGWKKRKLSGGSEVEDNNASNNNERGQRTILALILFGRIFCYTFCPRPDVWTFCS